MKNYLLLICVLMAGVVWGQVPEFEWVGQMGGSSEDFGTSISTDTSGNVYVTGAFRDTADFDPGAGVYNLSGEVEDGRNAFVAKYDTNGGLLWAFALASESSSSRGDGICTDVSGNVYVTGRFAGTIDFDPAPGVYNLSSMQAGDPFGSADIFILKLDTNGSFIWAVNMGTSEGGQGESITVDDIGNVYATGYFKDTVDFDPGPGIFYLAANGFSDNDIFITKLDSNGSFVWAKSMKGESGFDRSISIALDSYNNVYTTGYFESTADFNPGPGQFFLTPTGDEDMFISKLSSDGSFIWAKKIGGLSSESHGFGINVDEIGNVYTIGNFQGSDVDFDPGPDTFLLSSEEDRNIFISKFDDDGNFVWATSFGSTGEDFGRSIVFDEFNNIYATGSFEDTVDFDSGMQTNVLISSGDRDVFILKLDTNGSFIWAGSLSGNGGDHGSSIALDRSNNIYMTGSFETTVDFDPSKNIVEQSAIGDNDIFIHKMKQPCLSSLLINSSNTSSICSGDTISLATEISLPFEEISYYWNTSDTSDIILVAPDTSSIYTVAVTYLNDSSLCTLSDSVTVFVNQVSDTTYLNFTSCDTTVVGSVSFSLFDKNGCDSIVIENTTLISLPESPAPPSDTVITENAPPFQITVTEVLNATEYSWQVPAGVQILSGQGTASITVDWSELTTGGSVCVSTVNECGSSALACMVVEIDTTNAVKPIGEVNFSVFPNPADEFLFIVFPDDKPYEITLLDVLGKVVLPASSYKDIANIDVRTIPPGQYWLKVNKQACAWRRIVIQ